MRDDVMIDKKRTDNNGSQRAKEIVSSLLLALTIAINVISACFSIGLLAFFTFILFIFIFIPFSQTKQIWKECGLPPVLFKVVLIGGPILYAVSFLLAVMTF